MNHSEQPGSRRISVDLPNDLIERLDQLKPEWGLRARGDVLERLLEEIFDETVDDSYNSDFNNKDVSPSSNTKEQRDLSDLEDQSIYNENKALVLITTSDIKTSDDSTAKFDYSSARQDTNLREIYTQNDNSGINLPTFVQKNTKNIRHSLNELKKSNILDDKVLATVSDIEIQNALKVANDHWLNLYGQQPKDNVIEAAMLWLARDIWPNIDTNEARTFTWSAANILMSGYCPNWTIKSPNLQRIVVIAGILEDPFSSNNLPERIPTLIRRFVNKFKRSNKVTSFQTLESTMTVHGALKLLGLPTKAGASLTLLSIREAYKNKALMAHPDSGGTTESMRRVNEAYQLLKDLYRRTDSKKN